MTQDFTAMFTKFSIIGLMIFGILAFIITLESDNSVENTIEGEDSISNIYDDLGNKLGSFRDNASTQKQLFDKDNPTEGFGSILLFSIVEGGKRFGGMIIGVLNTIITLPTVILGLDPIIISVIVTIFIVGLITAVWGLIKLGG